MVFEDSPCKCPKARRQGYTTMASSQQSQARPPPIDLIEGLQQLVLKILEKTVNMSNFLHFVVLFMDYETPSFPPFTPLPSSPPPLSLLHLSLPPSTCNSIDLSRTNVVTNCIVTQLYNFHSQVEIQFTPLVVKLVQTLA